MKTGQKVLIIIALVCLVGVVFALKHKEQAGAVTKQAEMDSSVAEKQPITQAQGEQGAAITPLPQLIDLGADKCIPCKMMAPILDELEHEYAEQFTVTFYDVWKNKEHAKQYSVRSIPTQLFLDSSGKELFRHEGFFSKEDILKKWNELGYKLSKNETASE